MSTSCETPLKPSGKTPSGPVAVELERFAATRCATSRRLSRNLSKAAEAYLSPLRPRLSKAVRMKRHEIEKFPLSTGFSTSNSPVEDGR